MAGRESPARTRRSDILRQRLGDRRLSRDFSTQRPVASFLLVFPSQGDDVKILLIDDDEVVLETVALMLTSDDHTVLPVTSGREALARLEAGESVDLVLTDLNMPDMNGWDIVRTVRARWPAVRVGLNSGSIEKLPEPHEPLDLILRKPVNLLDLYSAISQLEQR